MLVLVAVLVHFPAYTGPGYKGLPGVVPIVPVKSTWLDKKGKAQSRTMLPLIVGFALSIHKLQGATVDKLILNVGPKEFALGLLYVGVTRVKRFEDLAFDPFPDYTRFDFKSFQQLKVRLAEEEILPNNKRHAPNTSASSSSIR